MNHRQASPPGMTRESRGSVLALAVIVSIIIMLTLGAAVSTTLSHAKQAQYSLDLTGALALSEGVTEAAQKRMLTEVANFKTPTLLGTISINNYDHPYTIVPIGDPVNRVASDGISMAVQTYRISSTTTLDAATTTVDRVVDLTMTPIFQFMIFYQDDLEILPGPSMILGGRVHCNRDIYIGCGNTLTVDTEYLRSTGDIFRKRKNDGSDTGGTVDIKVADSADYVDMTNTMDSDHADWINLALEQWNGTVQTGAHGVKEIAAPSIGSIKAFDPVTSEKGYYHQNADLVVKNLQAYDRDGLLIPVPPGTITEKTMYDGREGKNVKVTEIDFALLSSSGAFPDNGLIYAYREDASSAQPNGIRITNASELEKSMTLVSEDPVYVHGDFNTVNKKGAAVMSDAVNLLSNAWDDSKASGSLPAATNTQFNLSMVTGNVRTPDGGGSYSGGFENLPRFHEKWSGKSATIRGAFINIYESEIAKSPWAYGGDRYKAPIRDWQYDPDLNNMDFLPPFTPNAVYFRRVLWDDRVPIPLP